MQKQWKKRHSSSSSRRKKGFVERNHSWFIPSHNVCGRHATTRPQIVILKFNKTTKDTCYLLETNKRSIAKWDCSLYRIIGYNREWQDVNRRNCRIKNVYICEFSHTLSLKVTKGHRGVSSHLVSGQTRRLICNIAFSIK